MGQPMVLSKQRSQPSASSQQSFVSMTFVNLRDESRGSRSSFASIKQFKRACMISRIDWKINLSELKSRPTLSMSDLAMIRNLGDKNQTRFHDLLE
jgi:hypothetical protein